MFNRIEKNRRFPSGNQDFIYQLCLANLYTSFLILKIYQQIVIRYGIVDINLIVLFKK